MRKLLLASSVLLGLAVSVAASAARAAYIVTLTQEGSGVVAEGSGTIDRLYKDLNSRKSGSTRGNKEIASSDDTMNFKRVIGQRRS